MGEGQGSMYGSLIGAGLGSIIPGAGTIAGAFVGGLIGGVFDMFGDNDSQERAQAKLSAAQRKQQLVLWDKIKKDSSELYSAVHSSTSQKSGAMGAIY